MFPTLRKLSAKPVFAITLLIAFLVLPSLPGRAFESAPEKNNHEETSTPTHAEILARIKAEQDKAKGNQSSAKQTAEENQSTHTENTQAHAENKTRVETVAEENKVTHEAGKVVHEENKLRHEENKTRIEDIKQGHDYEMPGVECPDKSGQDKQPTPVQPVTPAQPEPTPKQPTPSVENPENQTSPEDVVLALPEVPTGAGGEYEPTKKILIRTGGF